MEPPQKRQRLLDARSKFETRQGHRTKVTNPPLGKVLGEIGVDVEYHPRGLQYGAQQSFEEIGTRQVTQLLGVAHSTGGGVSISEGRLNNGMSLAGSEGTSL